MSEEDGVSPAEPPKKKRIGSRSTFLRLASAAPLVPLVIWMLFSGPPLAFQIFGLVWIAICASEVLAMTLPESRLGRAWGFLATLTLAATNIFSAELGPDPRRMPTVLLLAAAGSLAAGLARPAPIPTAARRIGWMMATPVYVGATLSTLAMLHGEERGGAWVLFSMFLAFLSDTGAYFAGKNFGRRKLAPTISPKKTVEGSLGGLATATLGALILGVTLLEGAVPLWHLVLLAPLATALGQAGDLLESLIKRSCDVKDSGNVLPGHGGLLDRSDALMFTGPATWLYVVWLT
ncbi:MAG: phosphatidate cytidylyltransferase [Myxococcota bacterium]